MGPEIVWLRRCLDCNLLDDRIWYTTPEAASRAAGPGGVRWICQSCHGRDSILKRVWFHELERRLDGDEGREADQSEARRLLGSLSERLVEAPPDS